MRSFLIALTFFTRIKINLKNVTEDDFYNSMLLMPLVGLVIGIWITLFAWLSWHFDLSDIGAFAVIFAYFLITGGLHFDGVADTTDGLMSARDRKRVMEIMKDSRLGSFGALALILLFMANFASLRTLIPVFYPLIFMAPYVGRYCGLQNCRFSGYAEGGGGLGKRLTEITKNWHLVIYVLLGLGLNMLITGYSGMIAMVLAMAVAAWLLHIFNSKIGGMTGDTIGMTIELCQAAYLFFGAILAVVLPELCGGRIVLC